MANKPGHMLTDIKVYSPNKAMATVMLGAGMNVFLRNLGNDAVLRYKARVARRSGRLQASAQAHVVIGGHKSDRLVSKVTIGGPSVRAPKLYKGKPFFYGTLHDLGASAPKKARFPGAKDLRAVRDSMRPRAG